MLDVRDRSIAEPVAIPPVTDRAGDGSRRWSRAVLILLATLSAGAGAIHLAMVPSHADEWLLEGVLFAITGWVQIALALLLVTRPSRRLMMWVVAANVVFIGAWVVSRAWGWPVGPEAGEAHAASFVDVTCVALEAVLVAGAALLLLTRSIGRHATRSGAVVMGVIAIGVVALTTAAIASPSARNHAHDEAGGATHSHAAAGPEATTAAGAHAHSAGGADPAQVAFLFPDGDDKGWSKLSNGEDHGHYAPDVPIATLRAAERTQLLHQLAVTSLAAERFPTVAAAEAAGYRRAGPFTPGLGAHYTKPSLDVDGLFTDEELLNPGGIVYAGTDPSSEIVGFMYISTASPDDLEIKGFAGPNDHWHTHAGVCLRPGEGGTDALGADGDITRTQCEAQGGNFIADLNVSLLHVWTAPGYSDPIGIFAHLNPAITCPDGTYHRTKELGALTACRPS